MTEGALIGAQLKAARKLKGVRNTQTLADRINRAGLGAKVIGQIERDQRPARDHEIQWLAAALEMTVEDLTRTPTAEPSVNDRLAAIERRLETLERQHQDVMKALHDAFTGRTEQGAAIREELEQLRHAINGHTDETAVKMADSIVHQIGQRVQDGALPARPRSAAPKAAKTSPKRSPAA